jgi:hypothetical protein
MAEALRVCNWSPATTGHEGTPATEISEPERTKFSELVTVPTGPEAKAIDAAAMIATKIDILAVLILNSLI